MGVKSAVLQGNTAFVVSVDVRSLTEHIICAIEFNTGVYKRHFALPAFPKPERCQR